MGIIGRETQNIAKIILRHIFGERLEFKPGDTNVVLHVLGWLAREAERGSLFAFYATRIFSVPHVHMIAKRPDPVRAQLDDAKTEHRMTFKHTAENHRQDEILRSRMLIGHRPWIEPKLIERLKTLKRRCVRPHISSEDLTV